MASQTNAWDNTVCHWKDDLDWTQNIQRHNNRKRNHNRKLITEKHKLQFKRDHSN